MIRKDFSLNSLDDPTDEELEMITTAMMVEVRRKAALAQLEMERRMQQARAEAQASQRKRAVK
jgi:hypothetical protein